MKVIVIAQLLNELGDYREIEVELGRRHRWKPRLIFMKGASPEQLIVEAYEDAERIANERPPEGWPADRSTGTWKVVDLLNRSDLSGTQAERAAMWSSSGEG